MPLHIALDGPAGTGKSTVGKRLAKEMGLVFVDTGAMYRAFALKAARHGLTANDLPALKDLLANTSVDLDGANRVFLDGEDVSEQIRGPGVSELTSQISAVPFVRRRLVDLQRAIAAGKSVVMDGRDIGTVVLPAADLKVFMTASLPVRVKRRADELAAKGVRMSDEQIKAEVVERDRRDQTREDSPLRQADDAVEVKTDDATVDELVALLRRMAEQAAKKDR